ncbi:titin-like [Parasteatoda tepidariorum]|uniref:titin-like n=1 Tax=Parasteatoda tepidariorum TaxID=114398 RepID=UPI001C7194D8|nr:uncharacterized protein LOC107454808 [Parasteatoda tepidariorum]
MHYLRQKISALKTSMSSAVVFSVLSLFWQSVHCTVFPPVSNPPPIPGQDFRTLDISGQQFYVQDDLQAGIPQTVIKEDRFFSPTFESKPDDQWFVSDNESVARDFPTSSEAFERLYANGMPAIGPVATPPPDDNYIAQSTGTSKILPDTVGNLDSGVFVLTKGPNNQFITERWIPVQVPASKTIDIVNPGENPTIVPGNLPSAVPVKGFPKSQGVPADNLNIGQQVWIRVPASAALQKGYANVPTVVDNMPEVKEVVDVIQPSIKQNIQPQLVKGFPTFPSAPPQSPAMVINKSPINAIPPPPSTIVTNKSPSFVVPPPPPPIMKSIDIGNAKGTVMVNPTVSTIVDKGGFVGGKGTVAQQVKHIWIPTSQKTGNFITVPAGGAINENQPIISKGLPPDAVPPMSVSETWVLKDDGVLPRFEQQKTLFPVQNVGKEKTIVADPPVFVDSPKGVPTIGKSVDTVMTQDIWPQKTDMIDGKTLVKSGLPQQVFPVQKSNGVVVEKAVQMPPQNVQNVLPMTKVVPMLPPQPNPFIPSSPMATLVKGKPPCPITPQTAIMQGKPLPYPAYLPNSVQRQPMARIIRMNRYPFGSYYVVNPRMRPNLYPLPRQATIIKQVNNRIVRIIPSSSLPLTMPRRVTLPIRQMALPVTAGKTMMPMSRILYPPVQAVGRIRYAFPWGGYLNALPAYGRTASPSRPAKQVGIESSSSSSSSESAESREVPVKRKPKKAEKPKEKIKIIKLESEEAPIESLETIESIEPESEIVVEPEPELETAESVASETESEAVEADTTEAAPEPEAETEAEATDSLDIAESQFIHNIAPRSYLDFNYENIKNLGQPYRFGYERRERPSTFLAQETPELNGSVLGRYTYKDENGIYRNIAYVSDADSYKRELLNSESKLSNQKKVAENLGKEHNTEVSSKPLENVSESPLPFNIAFNLQRD